MDQEELQCKATDCLLTKLKPNNMKSMKILRLYATAALLCIGQVTLAGNPAGSSQQVRTFKLSTGVSARDYMPNTIIVRIDAAHRSACSRSAVAIPSVATAMNKIGAVSVTQKYPSHAPAAKGKTVYGRPMPDLGMIYEVKYEANMKIEDAINELLKQPEVLYAEPSYIYPLSYIPSDPDTSGDKNYYLRIIQAYEAWNVTKGDTSVVIAIVDSGTDIDHPDLRDNFHRNYADPVNGIDDDGDGYVDNFIGWDLAGADYNVVSGDNDPDIKGGNNDHGSHVSGDAAATTDNGIGVSGAGFKSRLMPVKCAADNDTRAPGGMGYILTGYEGIVYAADHGAAIINCSWGGEGGGAAGQEVIDYATMKGALVVAAAGNSSSESPHYPSAYEGVLSVVSTTNADRKSGFSNYGYSVDICAPGSDIYSTVYNNSYTYMSGTSMASPVAAGAAALVKAAFPSFTGAQVGQQLRVTCDNIYSKNVSSYKDKLGSGRINVYRAVTESSPAIRTAGLSFSNNSNGAFVPGDTVKMYADFLNYLVPTSNLSVTLSTTSISIAVLEATITQGVIGTMATEASVAPFVFVVKPGVPENTTINFKLTYSDGSYQDFEMIRVEVNLSSLNIDVNQVKSTTTSIGRMGYRNGDGTGGLGFVYKGVNMLYEASLMIGKSSSQVSNNARSTTATPDQHFVVTERVARTSDTYADLVAKGKFTDAASPSPIGLEIHQRQMAWMTAPNDKFIITEYSLINKSGSDLPNIYPGMFFDWDIADAAKNRAAWDSDNEMGYAMSVVGTDPMAGVKVLTQTQTATPIFYAQSHSIPGDIQEGGFSTAEKYTTLSKGVFNTEIGFAQSGGVDVMFTIGIGPFRIGANDTTRMAFAMIGGDNLSDLQASAQAAQNKYNNVIYHVGMANTKNEPASSLSLYPNPASGSSKVSFDMNKPSNVRLSVFNMLGQEVKLIFENHLYTGPYAVDANLDGLTEGLYFMVLNADGLLQTEKLIVR
jgi:serine protease